MEAEKYHRYAVMLARMYGVAETLEERESLPDYDFIPLMEEWAKEYIRSEEVDIVRFFERKMNEQE